MILDSANVGDSLRIKEIKDPMAAMTVMRMGIAEGAHLELAAKIPGGPVVVRQGGVEIALGRDICQSIEVEIS